MFFKQNGHLISEIGFIIFLKTLWCYAKIFTGKSDNIKLLIRGMLVIVSGGWDDWYAIGKLTVHVLLMWKKGTGIKVQ